MLDSGANIMKDLARGRYFRKSFEKGGKRGGAEFFNKVKTL